VPEIDFDTRLCCIPASDFDEGVTDAGDAAAAKLCQLDRKVPWSRRYLQHVASLWGTCRHAPRQCLEVFQRLKSKGRVLPGDEALHSDAFICLLEECVLHTISFRHEG